jgi:hypothetical protein
LSYLYNAMPQPASEHGPDLAFTFAAHLTCLQDELKKLLQAAWKQPQGSSKQQLSMLDLMHLATNQQRPAAAAMLFGFLQQQHSQLRNKKQQLEQRSATQQQQLPQQQPRIATRHRARREQQQLDLSQQVQQLQQRLQKFDQGAQGFELEQLLATAVARGHVEVLGNLCSLPAAAQLPSEAILQLLHRSIVHKSPASEITGRLLELAAAADAAAAAEDATAAREFAMIDEAAALDDIHVDDNVVGPALRDQQQQVQMQHQVQQQEQEPRQQLLSGPAAQVQLLRLLEAAVSRSNSPAVRTLVVQQALQTLDTATCSSLARTAIELRDSAALDALSILPGFQTLPVDSTEQLLAVGAQSRSRYIMTQLATLPNAAAISPASAAALLGGALQPEGSAVALVLVELPAAQNISVDDAAQLAEKALAAPTAHAANWQLQLVSRLPAASQLSSAALTRLLVIAIRQDCMAGSQAVAQLCSLTPAVLGLAAGDVASLLQTAATAGSAAAVGLLCQLPAASQLQADALYAVLQAAVNCCKPAAHGIVGQLCSELAGTAALLQPQQLVSLLSKAMALVSSGVGTGALRSLLRLPTAQQLQPDDASALMSLALQTPRAYDLLTVLLAWLPAAKEIEAAQLAVHVKAALVMEKVADAGALLVLPAASALTHEHVAALLISLFDQVRTPSRMQQAQHTFDLLSGRPAAQQMPAKGLMQILQELLRLMARLQQLPGSSPKPCLAWLQKLLALQPAALIAAADAEQLLLLALQQQLAAAPLLCQLPVLEQLDSSALQRLLTYAMNVPVPAQQQAGADSPTSSSSSSLAVAVGRLCKLPGTQQMQPAAYAALLRSALLQGRPEVLKVLAYASVPASRIQKAVLLELLKTAVQRMTGKVSAAPSVYI